MPETHLDVNGLAKFDLRPIFRTAVDLAEAAEAVTESEWANAPVDILVAELGIGNSATAKMPAKNTASSKDIDRWYDRHKLLDRIMDECIRLKTLLGASGPLDDCELEKGTKPSWVSYDQKFSNSIHDRSVRTALYQLAVSAVFLSGFAYWRRWHWDFRDDGIRLLTHGLANLWNGMTEDARVDVHDCLHRTRRVLGWPADLSNPERYDGPTEFRVPCRVTNYIARPSHYYPREVKRDLRFRAEQGSEQWLQTAKLGEFANVAREGADSFHQYLEGAWKADPGDLLDRTFRALDLLRLAKQVPPLPKWSDGALKLCHFVADFAEQFLATVEYNQVAESNLKPGPSLEQFEELRIAADRLTQLAISEESPITETVDPLDESGSAPLPKPGRATSTNIPMIALLTVFTNNVAAERFEEAGEVIASKRSANDRLNKIDSLIPLPATASAKQLGEMLGVSKQSVLKTPWWKEHRRGEKANEIGRRRQRHQERANTFDESDGNEKR
jgi:hypothetical protein